MLFNGFIKVIEYKSIIWNSLFLIVFGKNYNDDDISVSYIFWFCNLNILWKVFLFFLYNVY